MASPKQITPRDGKKQQVLGIARISTDHQDERSLDDQEALIRDWLKKNVTPPYELTMIKGRGSGERLDRQEYLDAIDAIETGKFDLVVMEDLARLCRRARSIDICETCEDCGTRLVAINDSLDTSKDDWRLKAGFAALHHEISNKDTSNRIRRSQRNRFQLGGMIRTLPYGYHLPAGAKFDSEIRILPEAIEVIDSMFTRLEIGATYSEIADVLNERNILPPPHVKSRRWASHSVKAFVFHPILCGIRRCNVRMAVRTNKSGRRKTILAPPTELLERTCPNLVIIERERWERVTAILRQRAEWRVQVQKNLPKNQQKPTKRADWPSRYAQCGVCGRGLHVAHVYTGKVKMTCSGSISYQCWNGLECSREILGRKLVEALLREIEKIPDYDEELLAKVRGQLLSQRSEKHTQLKILQQRIDDNHRRAGRLADAIAENGSSEVLARKLRELESERTAMLIEHNQIQSIPDDLPNLPPVAVLKKQARDKINALEFGNQEFGRLMNLLVPKIELLPYQMYGQNAKFLRCHATFNLAGLLGRIPLSAVGPIAEKEVVIDLFEKPLFIRLQSEIRRLHDAGMIYTDIAKELKVCAHTVFNTIDYEKKCQKAAIADPYILMTEPEKTPRHRNSRHMHPRFRFEPLPGYPIWLKT